MRNTRDLETEAMLLKQLAEMSYNGDSDDTESKVSEYGRDILEELEKKKNEKNTDFEKSDYFDENIHKRIQTKAEKNLRATKMIMGYISRKNEKNLRKEELLEDYQSVTDNQTLNQSRILNGSVFDDFDDDFKNELLQIKQISNPLMNRNQLDQMKSKVAEEMFDFKKKNPEIFDLGILESKDKEILNKSLNFDKMSTGMIPRSEIEELNRSIELEMERRKEEFKKDQKYILLQRERLAMAEEVFNFLLKIG